MLNFIHQVHEVGVSNIMSSSQLCKTDHHDNGMLAGDTMMIHLGGKNGNYAIIELYLRSTRHGWMLGSHILGNEGQIMIKPNPETGIDEMWHYPFDTSFVVHTPKWELVTFDKKLVN
ncbi:TPA: hypothetical protein EYN98_15755 [Candidatus Poribacteria bacterium]|nr:hypothetical protein [Candidatus Poribacteria bacterium]